LPSTLEWQWAAQGPLTPKWPWGNEDPNAELMPKFSNAPHVQPTPDAVDSHPTGASWAGVQDLVGNVYQWTDGPFQDDHTNHAVLRGGSKWRPNYYWYVFFSDGLIFITESLSCLGHFYKNSLELN
jgi:formylglycine-generating enzyme required for sulfatase activity